MPKFMGPCSSKEGGFERRHRGWRVQAVARCAALHLLKIRAQTFRDIGAKREFKLEIRRRGEARRLGFLDTAGTLLQSHG